MYCLESEAQPRIFLDSDDLSSGHIVASFLALRLEVDLQQRLEEREVKVSRPDLMRDLGQVQSVLLELDGNRYQLRTDMVGSAHHTLGARESVHPRPLLSWTGSLDGCSRSACKARSAENILVHLTCCYHITIFFLLSKMRQREIADFLGRPVAE
jgi:hypothetical protein